MTIADSDLEWHAWPPRPRGGQIVGTGGHGVLVIHLPTGLAAVATEERSQMRNREVARARLEAVVLGPQHRAALAGILEDERARHSYTRRTRLRRHHDKRIAALTAVLGEEPSR